MKLSTNDGVVGGNEFEEIQVREVTNLTRFAAVVKMSLNGHHLDSLENKLNSIFSQLIIELNSKQLLKNFEESYESLKNFCLTHLKK